MAEKSVKLDTGLIRELAAILRDADLGEIEVEHGDLRIRVCRPEPAPLAFAAQMPPAAPALPAMPSSAARHDAAPAAQEAKPVALNDHPGLVKSPMVGTVYLSPEKDVPAFVRVGDTVSAGQTLLLVEAMKTFNPVPAHKAGRVAQVLVSNEQPVEYGEPLVIIE